MRPPSETWFDRLAAPTSRREALKGAAIGAAAATAASLPFVRSPPTARAASPDDCRKGCVWTANQRYASDVRKNAAHYAVGTADVTIFGLAMTGPIGAVALNLWNEVQRMQFADAAVRNHRIRVENCFVPGCNGFDPTEPGGPCDGCESPLFCNPCPMLEIGYVCCVYSPADCHGDCCNPGPGCP